MKNFIFIIALSAFAFTAKAAKLDTASFTVTGICGMCEDRIENGAYINGVKHVSWDKDAQTLTVIYKPNKVTIEEVAQSVADAGHDNEYFKAPKASYDKIHHCCKYREQEVH